MRTISINGVEIAYDVHGTDGPWVVFGHSLGCTRAMWQRQIDSLARNCRVLAYDLRGHGQSATGDATAQGSLAQLASDVRSLMDQLTIERAHFVGISIGGMIGQTLAIESPDRIASLVVANTTAFMPPPAVQLWAQRIEAARTHGVASLARPSIERWFPEDFRGAHPALIEQMIQMFSTTSFRGYEFCSRAIMGLDTREGLARIRCPVLIIGGSEDPGAPVEALGQMQQALAQSELVLLQGAGHLSNIDRPEEFTAALSKFLLRCT